MSDLIKTLENINDKADSEPIYAVIIPKSKRNSGTQPTKEESSKKGASCICQHKTQQFLTPMFQEKKQMLYRRKQLENRV